MKRLNTRSVGSYFLEGLETILTAGSSVQMPSRPASDLRPRAMPAWRDTPGIWRRWPKNQPR